MVCVLAALPLAGCQNGDDTGSTGDKIVIGGLAPLTAMYPSMELPQIMAYSLPLKRSIKRVACLESR